MSSEQFEFLDIPEFLRNKQMAFAFITKHKKPIKEFGDKELIALYNKTLISLAAKVDELEFKLNEVSDD